MNIYFTKIPQVQIINFIFNKVVGEKCDRNANVFIFIIVLSLLENKLLNFDFLKLLCCRYYTIFYAYLANC